MFLKIGLWHNNIMKKQTLSCLFILATIAMLSVIVKPYAWSAARSKALVIFDANWCALCREVYPIAQDVAMQNGLPLIKIDLDDPAAVSQAKNLGLTIPASDPPVVYYVDSTRNALLLQGNVVGYGQPERIRSLLMQQLNQSKP
jgi:thiol-disulfide isomerase/thioredoxin